MSAIHIAIKDLQILFKDGGQVLSLFLVPLVFIFALSIALEGQGQGTEDGDHRTSLPVVNLDPDGEASRALIDSLNARGVVEVELYDQDEARTLLDDLQIEHVLTIPAGFSEDTVAGRPVMLLLQNHPNASETQTELLQRAINGVAQEMSLQAQIIASLSQMGDMQAAASTDLEVFTAERSVAQAKSQFERSRSSPLVIVEKTQPQQQEETEEEFSWITQNVPGYTIIIVFGMAITTAASIYNEKKVGSFRRLLAAPISKAALLAGKILPNFIMALIQIVVIFSVSILLLPIVGLERLKLGNDPLALALVSLVLAFCSTAFGVLVSAVARTEGQINTMGGLGVWLLGALGGCLLPPFMLEGMGLSGVSRLVPHYWAIRSYQDLIMRGQGLADVTTELLALLFFSAIFFAIGLWRFEFD